MTDITHRIQVQISAAPNGDDDTEIYYKVNYR